MSVLEIFISIVTLIHLAICFYQREKERRAKAYRERMDAETDFLEMDDETFWRRLRELQGK